MKDNRKTNRNVRENTNNNGTWIHMVHKNVKKKIEYIFNN